MKIRTSLGFIVVFGVFAVGCKDEAVHDVPMADRVERKEWDDMTKEEKTEFIRRTPVSEESKQRQIEAIERGEL